MRKFTPTGNTYGVASRVGCSDGGPKAATGSRVTNIPSAAVSGVVRTVLSGTRVINPIARHAFPSKQRESGCTGGSEPGAVLFDCLVGAGE